MESGYPYAEIGNKPIKLPLKQNEITEEKLVEVMPQVLSLFSKRREKIEELHDVCFGNHEIYNKKRPFSDQKTNNKISEPHLQAMVNFKTGYVSGVPKDYAIKNTITQDDMTYLGKYLADQRISAIDKSITEWIYSTGLGYYFIQPRTTEYDKSNEAPFNIYLIKPTNAVKVYSSYIGEEELFDIVVSDYDELIDNIPTKKQYLTVYTKDMVYECENGVYLTIEIKRRIPQALKQLPLVEKYANDLRLGIVETGLSLQNAIDTLTSTSIDNVVEFVNQIFVVFNADMTNEQFLEAKQNGVMLLKSTSQIEAKVDTIGTELNHKEVNIIYENLIKVLYDTNGVPLTSGNTTSDGDTGQARLLGNGWETAYTFILADIQTLLIADYLLLRKALNISKQIVNSHTKNLFASNIDIKYNINRSDNLLVKTQSATNLSQIGMPEEDILIITGMSSDPHSLAERWKINKQIIAQENAKNIEQNADTTNSNEKPT